MKLIEKYFTDFTSLQLRQLAALEHLYQDWNEKINVISRKDMEGLYERHVLHSLAIAAVFDFTEGTEIIDIGTGGGFPGMPLAIYFPGARFHLVDSVGKKLKVVQSIAEAIGLNNVSTQQIRAEKIRGRKFDFAVSRAVAPLKELWTWSKPLLRTSRSAKSLQQSTGGLICLKGGDLAPEISESGTRPQVIDIYSLFPEPYFKDKFLLFIPAHP